MLSDAANEKYAMTVDIIRQIALTGCRRSEMISLSWIEADIDASCMRLVDSKEGESIRPIGLPVVEYLEERRKTAAAPSSPRSGEDHVRQLPEPLGTDFQRQSARRRHPACPAPSALPASLTISVSLR